MPMNIRVLGCSGAIAAGCKTTAFLVDDDVLIDAGTGVGDLTLDELARIDHIFVTHSHLDHVLGIALLADSVLRARVDKDRGPIAVYALRETLDALRQHVFNNVIWPDFTRLPSRERPVLELVAVTVGQVVELPATGLRHEGGVSDMSERDDTGACAGDPHAGRVSTAVGTANGVAQPSVGGHGTSSSRIGRRIEVLSAAHSVPAVGYALHGTAGCWVFTGDTGPNPALWARLAHLNVAHLVIETAFADEEEWLARLSRHLHPAALADELAQLRGSVDVHITHIKPGEMDAVMASVNALATPHRVTALVAGQLFTL
ncbi:MAG: 3,5-cyclic-nucleotide phosphodiesterase [Rhizobacter sp.]|nr:3,5-cyclic-nucleotide phosphodiesterase [Rhizobacter sp.]